MGPVLDTLLTYYLGMASKIPHDLDCEVQNDLPHDLSAWNGPKITLVPAVKTTWRPDSPLNHVPLLAPNEFQDS